MKISRNAALGIVAISMLYSCSSSGEQGERSETAVHVEAYYPTQSTN